MITDENIKKTVSLTLEAYINLWLECIDISYKFGGLLFSSY